MECDEKEPRLEEAIIATNEANEMRSFADQRLDQSLTAQTDANVHLEHWQEALRGYRHALSIAQEYPSIKQAAEIALWQTYQQAPPPILEVQPRQSPVLTLTFSPNGMTVASGRSAGQIRLI